MPVSTFSADSSHVRRQSGHSGMIARWNSTRERMAEDERRMSMNQMVEMDGTGLWERENWPLGPGDGAGSPKNPRSPKSPRIEEEEVPEDAVFRKSEDFGREPEVTAMKFDEQDVSDVEEDIEHGVEDVDDRRHDHIRNTVIEMPRPRGRSDVSPVRESEMLLAARSPHSDGLSNRPIASSPTAPSPVRDGYDGSLRPPQDGSRDISREREDLQPFFRSESAEVSPVREEHARSEFEDTSDEGDVYRDRPPQHDSNGYSTSQSPDMDDELPPAFANDSTAPSTPNANGHAMRSSISKTTPPQRQLSSRRSPSITTQIPFNKERVRYSWQSVQDEEPNRPRIHIIKLVSNTASASAGFPQGEAFGFSISPAGRRIAAYNSARLYILQTGALPVGISQDYALKRRPLAVEIIDEGNLIAILADPHTVNLYDLQDQRMGIIRSIKLDFPTNCIALAPTGGLLAAAYEGGIEIFSLDPSALPTDRRAVRSVKMDRMTFSEDGSTLLGTTTRINVSSTVTVSVPVFPSAQSNIPTHEELKEAWCSELLHPENIRNSSHATFMRENRATCNDRLFAWNGLADTFGILNINDMQYGNIDFPVVISPPLSTCGGLGAAIHSPPAIDEHGDTVAMVVNDRTIRLYIVPHKLEDDETSVEAHSIDHELDEGYGCPFSEVRWVYSSASLPAPLSNQTQVQGRLIVTSPGGVVDSSMGEEMIEDIEGGRIILFDFDPQFAGQPGQTFSLTLGRNPPQLLEEPQMDVAQEVALVRRRTVNQSKGGGLSARPVTLGRAASTFGGRRERERPRNESPRGLVGISAAHRRSMLSINSLNSEATRSLPDLMETNEAIDTFEEPYAQNAPRSQASLQRAATNAQRHRFQTIEERNQERISVDSSGGFLPLPEYTEEPNAPLPSRFRAMAGLDTPAQGPKKASVVTNPDGDHRSPVSSGPSTAPAQVGESFSADQAFGNALAEQNRPSASRQRLQNPDEATTPTSPDGLATPSSPVARSATSHSFQRTGTHDSIGSIPRSLQRAYGNAQVGSGPPPSLIGDWANVSPITRANTGDFNAPPSRSSTLMNGGATVPEDEPWDASSPVGGGTHSSSSTYNGQPTNSSHHLDRALSSASSFATSTMSPTTGPSSRRPPHMQFLHRAAANNAAASASLFPPTQSSNHVPLRAPPARAGNVAHPITAWHPPAASTPSLGSPGLARSHSRKSSLSQRSAFASTAKARDLGFFHKRKKKKPFDPQFEGSGRGPKGGGQGGGGTSVFETKSMFTTFTGREGKCAVM